MRRPCYVGPNITGGLGSRGQGTGGTDVVTWAVGGAFSYTRPSVTGTSVNISYNQETTWSDIKLDASKDNATYTGTKVQVDALQLLACIRC